MLTQDGEVWKGSYITFRLVEPNPSKKTSVWSITGDDASFLGTVKWFSRWRKYCFFPSPYCVFEEKCLSDIQQFIMDRTREHKTKGQQSG